MSDYSRRNGTPKQPDNPAGCSKPKPQHAPAKELCLRFLCSGCHHWLSVPLRSIGSKDACPGCKAEVQIPGLDGYVVGLDTVHNFLQQEVARDVWEKFSQAVQSTTKSPPTEPSRNSANESVHSPSNGSPTDLPPLPHADGQRCGALTPAADNSPRAAQPQPTSRTTSRHTHSPTPQAESRRDRDPVRAEEIDSVKPKPVQPIRKPSEPARATAPLQATSGIQSNYFDTPHAMSSRGFSLSLGISRPAYWLSWIIWFSGISVFFFATALHVAFGFVWLAWMIPRIGWTLSDLIVSCLINTVSCPRCHEEHELVSIWACSCGYHDHKDRHLLRFKCPVCGSKLGRMNCRRCDSTILIA